MTRVAQPHATAGPTRQLRPEVGQVEKSMFDSRPHTVRSHACRLHTVGACVCMPGQGTDRAAFLARTQDRTTVGREGGHARTPC
jgi:hypothetical protein